jgi:signal transduction histidine kinase/CheY-like chemotaxis protein/HPt (histidine-containing phosphotransfer) domain-containing protein
MRHLQQLKTWRIRNTILFCHEYVERPVKGWIGPALAFFPVICTALVLGYPHSRLLYENIEQVITPRAFYLDQVGGILYYPYFFYNITLITYGTVYLMRHLRQLKNWRIRNTILFSAWFASIIISVILRVFRLTPGHFNLMPLLETLYLILIIVHIRRFRWQEWHSVGRELAIQNLKDAFILVDEEKRFLDANEAAFQCFPELRAFHIGTHFSKLGSVTEQLFNPEDRSLLLQLDKKQYFQISRSTLNTRYGLVIGQAIMLYDDTEREELIMQLNEALGKAEQATMAKTLFLARTSHEIRTPMNAIIGLAEIILRNNLPPDVYENALEIRRAGYILLSIINDILDFSKIESGKLEISRAEYRFTSLINDAISIIRMRLLEKHIRFIANIDSHIPTALVGDEARLRQILLNLLSNAVKYTEKGTITFSVSAVPIPADKERVLLRFEVADTGIGIKEADLRNLFTEFVRFDTRSSVEGTGLGLVISRQLARLMDGDIIVQSEHGKGSVFTAEIPQTVRNPAPFAIVEAAASKKSLLCERRTVYAASIMYSMNSLGVFCEPVSSYEAMLEALTRDIYQFVFVPFIFLEQTREFLRGLEYSPTLISLSDLSPGQVQRNIHTLVMPAYALSIANILNGMPSGKDLSYEPIEQGVRFIAPDVRILIVDDVTINLKVVRGLIAPYKMQIDCCTSGNEALRLAQEKAYDIVFLDHMMPGMDGIETLKAIRALDGEYFQKLTVIALTANAVQGMREMFLENGFQDYLGKPIEIARLDAALTRWIPSNKRLKERPLAGAADADNNSDSWFDELQAIEGLDIQDALSHVGSLENYMEVLKQFHLEMNVYIEGTKTAFDEKNWKDYALRLHSVKGAFGTIGMKGISEWARELEVAVKAEDMAKCQEQTEAFCEAMTAFQDRLGEILPHQQEADPAHTQSNAPLVDAAFVKEKMKALYVACYNSRSDDAEAVINSLNQVSFQEEWYSSLGNIRALVGSYEYEAAAKAVQAFLRELGGTETLTPV